MPPLSQRVPEEARTADEEAADERRKAEQRNMKRIQVRAEIISTGRDMRSLYWLHGSLPAMAEASYVSSLMTAVHDFVQPLRTQGW